MNSRVKVISVMIATLILSPAYSAREILLNQKNVPDDQSAGKKKRRSTALLQPALTIIVVKILKMAQTVQNLQMLPRPTITLMQASRLLHLLAAPKPVCIRPRTEADEILT